MSKRKGFICIFSLALFLGLSIAATAQSVSKDPNPQELEKLSIEEWNNQIRREKFDLVLPLSMRKNNVDMWIHVMRIAIPDAFGAEELGSTSGVFVFTDRDGDRIERAVLGRRWGETHRGWGERDYKLVEECGAYDIISDAIRVQEPLASPMIEYDFRFKGLREFVEARDPKRIAVNFMLHLGMWETYTDFGGAKDGLSHTDYLLLAEELGEKYASRLVSSEYVMMDYIIRKVPSEIKLLKKISIDRVERVKKAFAAIVPGVTKRREAGVTVFRRGKTGESQRGRSRGFNDVIQGGDIVAAPSQGMYGYVLREGETEPPPEIKKLWSEGMKIRKVLDENIKVGRTAAETFEIIKRKLDEVGIIVNRAQRFDKDLDPEKTQVSIDLHGLGKGSYPPRIGSLGPDYQHEMTLQMYHHFAVEFFMYMPLTSTKDKEDYLRLWFHDGAHATENGVRYLTPPPSEIHLIK